MHINIINTIITGIIIMHITIIIIAMFIITTITMCIHIIDIAIMIMIIYFIEDAHGESPPPSGIIELRFDLQDFGWYLRVVAPQSDSTRCDIRRDVLQERTEVAM